MPYSKHRLAPVQAALLSFLSFTLSCLFPLYRHKHSRSRWPAPRTDCPRTARPARGQPPPPQGLPPCPTGRAPDGRSPGRAGRPPLYLTSGREGGLGPERATRAAGAPAAAPGPARSERQGRARRRDSPLSTRPGRRRRPPAARGRDTPQTPRPGGTSAAGRISAPSGWPGPAAPLPRAPPRRALRRRGRAHARGRRTAAGRAGLRAGRGRLLRAGSRPRS